MRKRMGFVASALVLLLSGCAETSVMDVNANTVMVTASADPSCGQIGAKEVAVRRAAYETLKRGYDRYIIVETAAQDNTRVEDGFPVTIETKTQGNRTETIIDGGESIIGGSHDQEIVIKMFRLSDPGADKAVDARRVLGPDWRNALSKAPSDVC